MSLEAVTIRKEHLKDVAKLVCIRDKKLLEQVSSLPACYADWTICIPGLTRIGRFAPSQTGMQSQREFLLKFGFKITARPIG
jgi:hypothetical protein